MGKKIFIIAEAGVNHNGRLDLAEKLVEVAVEAGADAVKFQLFRAGNVVCTGAGKAPYQMKTTPSGESQFEMLKSLELGVSEHKSLMEYCRRRKIGFLSSPFDIESADFLHSLGLDIFKIPSGEITNLPYLRRIGSFRKKIILSTGMACLGEIEDALDILTDAGTERGNITILHCNTEYPTPMEDVNLKSMQTIGCAFGLPVGYSDHTPGIEVAIAAAALGAIVIEKHVTLDKSMEGPDHRASLDPCELKDMVRAVRNIEKALGSKIKKPSSSELKNKLIARKSIVAKRFIRKGEVFSEDNLTVKRPGNGVSPMRWDEIIGSEAKKHHSFGKLLKF